MWNRSPLWCYQRISALEQNENVFCALFDFSDNLPIGEGEKCRAKLGIFDVIGDFFQQRKKSQISLKEDHMSSSGDTKLLLQQEHFFG